jgi:DNA replication protein DnaC/glycosyltransferase involved in cell wall biosynthesis
MRSSRLPAVKLLSDFDFSFQPSVKREQIDSLHELGFVERKENVTFRGPPGVGKTHLAISLAIEAAQHGRRVYYGTLADLITSLEEAQASGKLQQRLKVLTHPAVLVVDEIGYLPTTRTGAMLFFQLMTRRYEHASTVLTSNKGFEDWGEIFGDEVMAAALIDRLLHHCHIVNIRGNSYRMRQHSELWQALHGASEPESHRPHPGHGRERRSGRTEARHPWLGVRFSPARSVRFSSGVDSRQHGSCKGPSGARSRRCRPTVRGKGTINVETSVERRLLLLSFHAPPEPAIGGLRWWGLSRHLARRGWAIHMITAAAGASAEPVPAGMVVETTERRRTLQDRYRAVRSAQVSRNPIDGAGVSDNGGPANERGAVRSSLSALLSFPDHGRGWMLRAAAATRRAVRQFRPAVIVSTGPPHSVHLAAALGLGASGVPWVLDFRDPWTDVSHPYTETGWRLGLLRRLERACLRRAALVLTTTPDVRDAVRVSHTGVQVAWLPNGVDAEALPPRSSPGFPGLCVTHLGSLYFNRNPTPALRAFAAFLTRNPLAIEAGSTLRFVGSVSTDFRPALDATIAELGIGDHVQITGVMPRANALEILAKSQVALVLAQAQKAMVPAKLYEAVAMGLPTLVLTEDDSATAVEAKRLGAAVYAPDDEHGIADTLSQVWSGAWATEGLPAVRDHSHLASEAEELFFALS